MGETHCDSNAVTRLESKRTQELDLLGTDTGPSIWGPRQSSCRIHSKAFADSPRQLVLVDFLAPESRMLDNGHVTVNAGLTGQAKIINVTEGGL